MKNLIFYSTIILLLIMPVYSQTEAPPAPLRYSKPDTSLLQEFSAPRYGFKITFAGKPSESKEYLENENIFTFSTSQNGSSGIVKVTQLKTGGVGEISESKIFNSKKTDYLSNKKSSLDYEKDISVGNRNGKEYGINQGISYRKIRVFIFKNHVYEISIDVINWHVLQQFYKEKVKDFESESLRFFESFQFQPITITGSRNITG